jgi:hypothetical protein
VQVMFCRHTGSKEKNILNFSSTPERCEA